MDVTQLNRHAGPIPQRQVISGFVSTAQPAPTGLDGTVYVIAPGYSIDRPLGPCKFTAVHGATLPAQGAECLVVFDDQGVPIVVWWDGTYNGTPSGSAGGDLAGTYPNPTLATARQQQLFQPGDLKMSAVSVAPTGWLLCDGSPVSRTTYAALFTAIGSAYGPGNGSTTFNVPDFRGRSPLGVGTGDATGATAHALGSKAGEETHLLANGEMPVHNHGGATSNQAVHTIRDTALSRVVSVGSTGSSYGVVDTNSSGSSGTLSVDNHTHPIANDGGGGAHNNLGPILTVNFLIKT